MKIIHNVETNEITTEDLSADELKAIEAARLEAEKQEKAIADREQSKKAILEKLGLSEQEASILLG